MSDRKVPARWQGTPAEPYWMNPEACARLVEEHGSQRAAGRAIGVSQASIRYWMDPDSLREYHRGWKNNRRDTDPEFRELELARNRVENMSPERAKRSRAWYRNRYRTDSKCWFRAQIAAARRKRGAAMEVAS